VVQRAAARALVALPDSIVSEVADPLVQLTTASAGSNPEVRALLEAEFDRVRPGHFSGPAAAAEALLEVPGVELQADLSRWLEAVLARGPAQLTADLAKVANSDWALTRVVWNLARLAYRDGHSSAAATHAALGVLGFLSVGLGTPEETAQRLKWSKVKDDPWAFAGSPAQATATYAVQIVAASTEPGAKEALEALRWARDAEPFDAQPTFKDPVRDHRGPNDVSRVSGWMGWAVKRLSRAP
jgi:hypothetical protein